MTLLLQIFLSVSHTAENKTKSQQWWGTPWRSIADLPTWCFKAVLPWLLQGKAKSLCKLQPFLQQHPLTKAHWVAGFFLQGFLVLQLYICSFRLALELCDCRSKLALPHQQQPSMWELHSLHNLPVLKLSYALPSLCHLSGLAAPDSKGTPPHPTGSQCLWDEVYGHPAFTSMLCFGMQGKAGRGTASVHSQVLFSDRNTWTLQSVQD